MPLDQIEMYWRCSACGTVNGGLSKRCGQRVVENGKIRLGASKGCGKALEKEGWFAPEDISSEAALTSAGDIEKALAGPDWRCPYCGSSQRRGDGECANCGGEEIKTGVPATSRYSSPSFSSTSSSRYSSPPLALSASLVEAEHIPKRGPKPLVYAIVGGILTLGIIVAFALWPRFVDAKVTATHWESTVKVEKYQIVPEEGWDVPGDSFDRVDQGRRVHHYDKVQIGTRQDPYLDSYSCGQDCTDIPRTCSTTPRSCSSNGNGTMSCTGGDQVCTGGGQSCSTRYCTRTAYRTVPVYEDQPRYQHWYTWRAWRWKHARTIERSGDDLQPLPPDPAKVGLNANCSNGEKERANVYWVYSTIFADKKGKPYVYTPHTQEEFQRLTLGTKKRLKVTMMGVSLKEE